MLTETTPSSVEIVPSEFAEHTVGIREALQQLCEGAAFRTSPKSCEFLRHIVGHTLAGETDQLKERLIGMSLLGRDASYDTGSDAGVRVRANEVRKRLAAHYSAMQTQSTFFFELPVGAYVPRFFRSLHDDAEAPSPQLTSSQLQSSKLPSSELQSSELPAPEQSAPSATLIEDIYLPPLSLYQLAAPTLVALFLCVICIRWQVAQEHPFTSFWNQVFDSHASVLYLPQAAYGPAGPAGNISASELQAMRTAAPLLNLAGQFHSHFKIVNTPDAVQAENSVQVSVGDSSGRLAPAVLAVTGQSAATTGRHAPPGWRLLLASTPQGQRIVDTAATRSLDTAPQIPGHAALLTIVNDSSQSGPIDGTDEESIRALVDLLCGPDTFPSGIENPFEAGTVVQVMFPLAPASTAQVFRQPLHEGSSAGSSLVAHGGSS